MGPVIEFSEDLPDDIPVMIREESGHPVIIVNAALSRVERAKALDAGKRMLRERRRAVLLHLGALGEWGQRLRELGDGWRMPATAVAGSALAMTMVAGSGPGLLDDRPQRPPGYAAQGPTAMRTPGSEPAASATVADVYPSPSPGVARSTRRLLQAAAAEPPAEGQARPTGDPPAEGREPRASATQRGHDAGDVAEQPAAEPAKTGAAATSGRTRGARPASRPSTREPDAPQASAPTSEPTSPAPEPEPEPSPRPIASSPKPGVSVKVDTDVADVDVDVPLRPSELGDAVKDTLKNPVGIGGGCDGLVNVDVKLLPKVCVGG
ncbi:hypothetical protein [Nonomuraea sp. NPDC050202]|uniref:hypothetical protein n=1 Tax=Nonomuraea sp. NPDC050202 TaxID=3155035 RepID=UPI0033E4338B